MTMPGPMLKELHEAFLDAFNRAQLARVVRFTFDERMDSIAGQRNDKDAFFELIEWAETTGHLSELISATYSENPTNAKLKKFYADWVQLNSKNNSSVDLQNGHRVEIKEASQEHYNSDEQESDGQEPENAEDYITRGVRKYNAHKLEDALSDFDKAIELDPKCARAYYCRATIYGDKRELNKAIKDLDESISLNPEYTDAYALRFFVHIFRGNLRKAVKDFGSVIKLLIQDVFDQLTV